MYERLINMGQKSFRKTDMNAEEKLADFMDHNFYSKLHDRKGNKVSFKRYTDAETQLKGIDIEIIADNKSILIDEKASFYYSNVMIPTFAFEIDSIQSDNGDSIKGWFVNDALKTEYYMLIWPNVKCQKEGDSWIRKNIGDLEENDFTIIEAMLIEKKKLIAEVERRGFTVKGLMTYAFQMRKKTNNGNEREELRLDQDINLVYSGYLYEKPINAVINKRILKELASAIYLISEDGYAQIL